MKALLPLLAVLVAVPGWAHVVASDGPIGVSMHVDPDDSPIAGKPTRFYLWFKDTSGALKPEDCRGSFIVSDAANFLIASQPLFARSGSGMTDVHDLTFEKPGVYTVRINGAPKGATTFPPFLIEFKVRVTGDAAQAGIAAWPLYAGGAVLAALFLWWGLRPAKKPK